MVYRHTEKLGELKQDGQNEKTIQNRIISFDLSQIKPMN